MFIGKRNKSKLDVNFRRVEKKIYLKFIIKYDLKIVLQLLLQETVSRSVMIRNGKTN